MAGFYSARLPRSGPLSRCPQTCTLGCRKNLLPKNELLENNTRERSARIFFVGSRVTVGCQDRSLPGRKESMVEIIEKFIPFGVSPEEDCPILLAQLPNQLRYQRFLYQVADPEQKWAMVKPILEVVTSGEGHFNRTKFLAFPEASIPFRYKDEIVRFIDGRFPSNSVVILGFEHIRFSQYWQLLSDYRAFNEEAYELVSKDEVELLPFFVEELIGLSNNTGHRSFSTTRERR